MRDGEDKTVQGAGGRARTGSGVRAKNRTVIMGAAETGGVRARLGGEFGNATGSGRIGGLEDPNVLADPHWERPTVHSEMLVARAEDPAEIEDLGGEDPAMNAAEQLILESPASAEHGALFEELAEQPQDSIAESEQIAGVHEELWDAGGDRPETSVDPLGHGILEEEADVQPLEQPAATPPVSRIVRTVGPKTEQPVFTPDPPPQFVAVEEEHMLSDHTAKPEEIFWKAETQLVGFLVTFDNEPTGAYLELRTGRLIVTSQQEGSGNCLVLPDESVSPMHAVMRVAAGGVVQVLDQLSESGTRIRKCDTGEEVLLSGEKGVLEHGDVVSFGNRSFHVCLIVMHQ